MCHTEEEGEMECWEATLSLSYGIQQRIKVDVKETISRSQERKNSKYIMET